MAKENGKRIRISILFPDFTSEEQIEAEENLIRYLAAVKSIFEHITEHKPELLTEIRKRARLRRSRKGA